MWQIENKMNFLCLFLFREGHYETTALLLQRGAQVNVPSGSNDDTPLTLACWKGDFIGLFFLCVFIFFKAARKLDMVLPNHLILAVLKHFIFINYCFSYHWLLLKCFLSIVHAAIVTLYAFSYYLFIYILFRFILREKKSFFALLCVW